MTNYSTNLTDKQWKVINKILNFKERKRKHDSNIIFTAKLSLSCIILCYGNSFLDGRARFPLAPIYQRAKKDSLPHDLTDITK